MAKPDDLIGKKFGNALVIGRIASDKCGHTKFHCKCLLCGKEFDCLGTNLKTGKQTSCGCVGKQNRKYGREKTKRESKELGTNIGKIKSDKPNKNNVSTGVRGVSYIKTTGMYVAYIGFQGKRYALKTSTDFEACVKARKTAEEKIYGDFLSWYDEYKKSADE